MSRITTLVAVGVAVVLSGVPAAAAGAAAPPVSLRQEVVGFSDDGRFAAVRETYVERNFGGSPCRHVSLLMLPPGGGTAPSVTLERHNCQGAGVGIHRGPDVSRAGTAKQERLLLKRYRVGSAQSEKFPAARRARFDLADRANRRHVGGVPLEFATAVLAYLPRKSEELLRGRQVEWQIVLDTFALPKQEAPTKPVVVWRRALVDRECGSGAFTSWPAYRLISISWAKGRSLAALTIEDKCGSGDPGMHKVAVVQLVREATEALTRAAKDEQLRKEAEARELAAQAEKQAAAGAPAAPASPNAAGTQAPGSPAPPASQPASPSVAPPITDQAIRKLTVPELLAGAGFPGAKKRMLGKGKSRTVVYCARAPKGDIASEYCARDTVHYGDATRDGSEEALIEVSWDASGAGGNAHGTTYFLVVLRDRKPHVVWSAAYATDMPYKVDGVERNDCDGCSNAELNLEARLRADALVLELAIPEDDNGPRIKRETYAGLRNGKLALVESTAQARPASKR